MLCPIGLPVVDVLQYIYARPASRPPFFRYPPAFYTEPCKNREPERSPQPIL